MHAPTRTETKLSELQQRFVEEYVAAGDGNATAAARRAGYADASAAKSGCANLQSDAVLAAITAETARTIGRAAPRALRTMIALASKAKSEFVRQTAAADLLNRAGHKSPEQHMVAVGGRISIDIGLVTEAALKTVPAALVITPDQKSAEA